MLLYLSYPCTFYLVSDTKSHCEEGEESKEKPRGLDERRHPVLRAVWDLGRRVYKLCTRKSPRATDDAEMQQQ